MTPVADPLESILTAAVEIPAEADRRAYLDRACAGDPDLRRRVDELIDNHFRAGSFLEAPAVGLGSTTEPMPPEQPGARVGPYKLLEQIGEGGMGVVFMAEQHEPVRRKVALKVIKPGMDTRQVIARFEQERQALALMDHPHIAKVLDAGTTESGRPFFVMELVRGVPITAYCDQEHLTPRQRLELFVPVCQAVQHAHQKGVIHRDLKPSNVLVTLVDGRPVPKVIDFGVAKAAGSPLTDKTLFTGFAQMVGTPLYMSPEQAAISGQDVDTRSDVYSLGVLLYELLTGTTPFDKERFQQAAYDEIRRIIREEEPPRPSTRLTASKDSLPSVSARRGTEPAKLTRLVRGELDWIVMRCLEKDRNRRYETPSALGADVGRYLTGEAVLACPPTAWYRARKFVRRNKGSVLAGAAVAAALVLGTVVSAWQAVRADQAEKRAKVNLETAEAQRQRAEQHFLDARSAVDQITKVGQERLKNVPHMTGTRRELLETALAFHEKFLSEESNDPTLRHHTGQAFLRAGDIQVLLGQYDLVPDSYRKALAHLEAVNAQFPGNADYRHDLARALCSWGHWVRFPAQAAKQAVRRGLGILDELKNQFPAEPEYQDSFIECSALGAHVLMYNSDGSEWDEAERVLNRALELQQSDDVVPNTPAGLANAKRFNHPLGLYCHLLRTTGRMGEAEEVGKRWLARIETLYRRHPRDWELLWNRGAAHLQLGWVFHDTGRLLDGEREYRAALADKESWVAEFPNLHVQDGQVARTLWLLSSLLYAAGRRDESLEVYRRALAVEERILANSPTLVDVRTDVAMGLVSHPDPQSRHPARALELASAGGEALARLASGHTVLGQAYYRVGNWEAADETLAKSIETPRDQRDVTVARYFRAMARWQLGDTVKARELYDQAVRWTDKNRPYDGRLRQFRAEVEELMTLPRGPTPKGGPPKNP